MFSPRTLAVFAALCVSQNALAECNLINPGDEAAKIMTAKGFTMVTPAESGNPKSVRDFVASIPEGSYAILALHIGGANYRLNELVQKKNGETVLKSVSDGSASQADLLNAFPNCKD